MYLIFGPNDYAAYKKIRELKFIFQKKAGPNFFSEEISKERLALEGDESLVRLNQRSLFVKKKFVVFKDAVSQPTLQSFLKENIKKLQESPDIFLFWERDLDKKNALFSLLEKHAEKIQEAKALSFGALDKWFEKKAGEAGLKLSKQERSAMIEAAGGAESAPEWALENELEKLVLAGSGAGSENSLTPPRIKSGSYSAAARPHLEFSYPTPAPTSPFGFVEKIFSEKGSEALLTLKKAVLAGHIPEKLIYPLLWKAKQKKMRGAYKKGILAESAMRRDPKNAYEHMERFILALRV